MYAEYKKRADEARKEAFKCRDEGTKKAFLKIAGEWDRLAEQASKMNLKRSSANAP